MAKTCWSPCDISASRQTQDDADKPRQQQCFAPDTGNQPVASFSFITMTNQHRVIPRGLHISWSQDRAPISRGFLVNWEERMHGD